jgi:hypothetical protein
LSTKEAKSEDVSWLLNWILGAFSEYGLQMSSSTPTPGQVKYTAKFYVIMIDDFKVNMFHLKRRTCVYLSPSALKDY